MKHTRPFFIIIFVLLIGFGLFFISRSQSKQNKTGVANPASVNCIEKGGTVKIEKGPSGEYGICIFEDNRQCEEWALFRNECPVGGVKITGYTTDTSRYCAITGGTYTTPLNEIGPGTCTLPDGSVCDADSYYQGTCTSSSQESTSGEMITATFLCKDDKSIDAEFVGSKVSLTLSDGRSETLNQAMSASGARYANNDESFVFWNKGNTAFIEEQGTVTFANCVQKE